jgi:2-amino-4-hydroxy-6-hydroxymethyldihydropteridine diphosphokinase
MSDAERRAYVVGLGANLGDRRETLRSAVSGLAGRGRLLAVSDLYETAAVGPPQPDYLNAAVLLETVLTPQRLLLELLAVERAHGRVRAERWGPRTLDLDLLHSPDLVVVEPDLTLPHPELARRSFALLPLLDVLPDARDAHSGVAYAHILRSLAAEGVRRLETHDSWYPGRAE